ncbi:hypothetical protein K2173_021668 [Erythroxylum novogranatense]|uniref:F-box domain-containing protein n=1 Tax=Erythroxylum novogranatense TaxID=1862640 RepID=A0AAV8TGZ7_9ROSI|nr:hypothetical protein K2173_021668 [Erythroxylum novogranatense]
MGANFSSVFTDPNTCSLYGPFALELPTPKTSLDDLPESCVASIIGCLDPVEICKLSRLNRAFRGASWADFIWDSKLPENYENIMAKLSGGWSLKKLSKREIYSKLCKANSLDDGTKKVWLDKRTGGVCLSISFKGLSITGIDDRRYWNHIPTEESRFNCVAYLQQIWWFEVDGELEFPFPAGSYSLFFRLQLGRAAKRFGRRICNTEHVHGWDIKPVHFQLWTSDGQHTSSKCFLEDPGIWNLYHVGDFIVHNPNSPTKLKFSLTQIDCTHTKGGLCLDGVIVYPFKYSERLKQF